MAQTELPEFPFMAELPKGEKSRLQKFRESWEAIKKIQGEKGPLMPRQFCADLANVSKQRIKQLIEIGRLEGVEVGNQTMITESSFEAWMLTERKPGRPRKTGLIERMKANSKMTHKTRRDMERQERQGLKSLRK